MRGDGGTGWANGPLRFNRLSLHRAVPKQALRIRDLDVLFMAQEELISLAEVLKPSA